ncbi:AraC family transcriptional regulator [Cupriavidus oxalaticus]
MKPPPPVTVPVIFLNGLLAGLRARGHDCRGLLADAGIDPSLLELAGARVTATQYAQVFRLAIERFGDEGLGFLSRPLKPGSFALIAREALSAQTLDLAIRRAARAFGLLQDDVAADLRQDGERAGLVFRFITPAVGQQLFFHELLVRVFWRLLAWMAGGRLPATRFDFAFGCPPYAGSYGKIFPAQLAFDEPLTAFWFDASWLRHPVRRDEAALRAFLAEVQANLLVPRRVDDVVSARVRACLQRSQPAWPDLAATAGSLHVSTATLQRKLALEGTSFQALKDDLRRDLAIVRLNTSKVSLAELAQELGFTDSAAFQRAFKGWTGTAPGAYRRGGSQ